MLQSIFCGFEHLILRTKKDYDTVPAKEALGIGQENVS